MRQKIKRFIQRIKIISVQSNKSVILLFIDFLVLKAKLNISFYEYFKFDLEKKNNLLRQDFLSATNKKKYLKVLNPRKYFILARNKYISHILFNSNGIKTSKLYCYYNPFCVNTNNIIAGNINEVYTILNSNGIKECVIKTTESSHGEGVNVIKEMRYINNDIMLKRFDGKERLLSDIIQKEPLIFESLVKQTKQFHSFNSSSVNTVRIMTGLKKDGSVKIFGALLKVGRTGSCVDNVGDGGNVSAKVDLETGTISNVTNFQGWRNWKKTERHPDSEELLEGIQIKNWEFICCKIKEYQKNIPFLKTIGWDVAITDDGPLIIEMNDYWDETSQLFIGGWLNEIENLYNEWKNEF